MLSNFARTPTDTIDILRSGLLRIGHILACVAEERGILLEQNSDSNNWQRARFIESSIQHSHSQTKKANKLVISGRQKQQQKQFQQPKIDVQFIPTNDPTRPFRVMMMQSIDAQTWERIRRRKEAEEEARRKADEQFMQQVIQEIDAKEKQKKTSWVTRFVSQKSNVQTDASEPISRSSSVTSSKGGTTRLSLLQKLTSRKSSSRSLNDETQSDSIQKNDTQAQRSLQKQKSSRLFSSSQSLNQLADLKNESDEDGDDVKSDIVIPQQMMFKGYDDDQASISSYSERGGKKKGGWKRALSRLYSKKDDKGDVKDYVKKKSAWGQLRKSITSGFGSAKQQT
eukprot:TRINITY_DN2349_c1_g2_i1.p1 TRINITY_DN2349_c1_g2~~TRINITY_DN2349_c1_g2_i1.p1  ORF type:complete len:340 (+),score=31.89 TRINITY_DN2349_c1_g2_i1:63-1082(+)